MARGLTALRAALGAVGGVTDALQQRELLAEKRRRDEEAAAIQQAQLYASLGMRPQLYRPASEEQVGVAPASSMDRAAFTSALQRGMGVEPPTRDGVTTSFQRSVQRGMGVEPTQAGATLSPLQSAFQKATSGDLSSSYTKRTAETPGMRQKLPGGMEVAWQSGPTDEEKAQQAYDNAMRLERGKRELLTEDARTEAAAKAERVNATAALIKATYRTANGKPLSDEASRYAAESGKTPIELGLTEKPMTEAERKNLQATWARIGIDQQRATQQGVDAQTKKRQAQEGLMSVLPTIGEAAKAINSWGEKEIKQLSPTAIAALNQASLQGGLSGVFLSTMASQMTNPLDRRYLQYASSIADAVARASEVGVLTNQDINRFRNQVLFIGGEELSDKRFKVDNLRKWANWLSTNKGTLVSGEAGRSSLSLMPGETEEEAQQLRGWTPANPKGQDVFSRVTGGAATQPSSTSPFGMPASGMSQDPDYASALNAIKRGADRAAVIARYESSGKKWPGGR